MIFSVIFDVVIVLVGIVRVELPILSKHRLRAGLHGNGE